MTTTPDILQELQRIKEDESLFPETCSKELLAFIKENDEGWYQMRAGQELLVRETGRALVAIPKEDAEGNVVLHEKTGKPVVDFTYTIGNARRGAPEILCFYPSSTGGHAINNFSDALINKEVNLPSGKDPEVATGMFEDKSLTVIYQWITGDKRKLAADKYACQLKDDDPLLLLMLPTPDGQHHIQFTPEGFLDGGSSTPEPSGGQTQSEENAYGDVDLNDEEVTEVRDSMLNAIAERLNSDTSVKEDLTVLYSYFCNFLGWLSQEGHKQSPRSESDVQSAVQIVNGVFDKMVVNAFDEWGMSEEELIGMAEYASHLKAFEENNLNFASVVQILVSLNTDVMSFLPEYVDRALEKEEDSDTRGKLERSKALLEASAREVEKALQLLHNQ